MKNIIEKIAGVALIAMFAFAPASAGAIDVLDGDFGYGGCEVGDEPVFTSASDVEVTPNYTYYVQTLAAGGVTPNAFEIVGGADADMFSIWGNNLDFVDLPQGDNTDANGNNIYEVDIQVSNECGTDVQTVYVTAGEVASAPAASCTLTAAPDAVVEGGDSTISWTTENAVSVTLNNLVGAVDLNGTFAATDIHDWRYSYFILTAVNADGEATQCVAQIALEDEPVAEGVSFTLNDSAFYGQTVPMQVMFYNDSYGYLSYQTANVAVGADGSVNFPVDDALLSGSESIVEIYIDWDYKQNFEL